MCIHIAVVDHLQDIAVWDPDEVLIFVQRGTPSPDLISELHELLRDLGAPTDSTGGALTCFCSEPIELPHELLGDMLIRRRLHHLDLVESLIPRQVPRGA